MDKRDKEYLDSMGPWIKQKELVIEEDEFGIIYLRKMISNYKKQIIVAYSNIKFNKRMLQVGCKDIEEVKDRNKK